MRRVGFGLALLCLAFGTVTASAQDKYPSKPVKIVVPYAPGGATDIMARILGEQLRQIPANPSWSRTSPAPTASSPSMKWSVPSRMATR